MGLFSFLNNKNIQNKNQNQIKQKKKSGFGRFY